MPRVTIIYFWQSRVEMDTVDFLDTDTWSGSWFGHLPHLVEYLCIHAAILPVAEFGAPQRTRSDRILLHAQILRNANEILQLLANEPYGMDAKHVMSFQYWDAWLSHVQLVMAPYWDESCQIWAFMDDQNVCCIMSSDMAVVWLIHASKLCRVAPKSKRRGLSDERRADSVLPIDKLAPSIAKKWAATEPSTALISDATFAEALFKCWIQSRYLMFANTIVRAIKTQMENLEERLLKRIGSSEELHFFVQNFLAVVMDGKSTIPVDVTWFVSRFDIYHEMMSSKLVTLINTKNVAHHLYTTSKI